MNSIVNLKDGFITFNSNIDNSLSFSKCAIGYSNYSINSHERGSLVFLTNNNANTTNVSMPSDIRMCIASDGNVGIGTNNPTQKLDIAGNVILSGTISGNGSLLTSINAANISSGTIDSLRLPVATTSVLGGVKKGNHINIDGNGTISVDLQSYNGDSTITNEGANSTLTIKQTTAGNTNNILNVINSATLNVFNVSSTGNAGIGTTNANNRLHLHNTTANSDVGIRFSDFTSGASATQGFTIGKNTSQQAYLWNFGNTGMLFATNGAERLRIGATGTIGIGTNTNIQSILTINPIVIDRSTFDHSEAPLTITNPTTTSTSVLNDPKAVLHLCRQGTNSQAFGARASFKLCRYENSVTNSRTRLDITLAHGEYDDLNIMSLQSSCNVGIGTTNPVSRLHLHNTTANSDVAIRFTDFTSGSGAANGFVIGENSAQKAYLWNYGNTDMLFATNGAERMIISNTGNVGIGTNNALSSLHLHKNALAQDVRMIISDNTSTSSLTRGLHLIKATDNIGYLWNYENTPLILATNSAERLRILANGNVGIGTTNPETALDVNGNLLIRAYGTSGSGTRGIFFRQGDFVTTNLYNCSILTFDHGTGGTTDGLSFNGFDGLSFCTGANTRQERMRITDTGNVGIGTDNIAYKLHVKCVNDSISSGLHLDASDETPPNKYALTIYPYVVGSGQVGWKFRTQSQTGGTKTPLTFDNAGNVILEGTISGNGSLLTTINAANISSGTIDSLRLPTASTTVLGGVKVDGSTITINSSTGAISGTPYVLPTASTSVLGGLKVDGTIHTIITDTLKIIEPTSKQIVEESVIREYPSIRNFEETGTAGYSGKPYTVSGQLYGNGIYTIYYTSKLSSGTYTPNNLWSNNGLSARWANANYMASGNYNQSLSIVGDTYLGDGVKIQFPVSIKITSYTLRHDSATMVGAAKDFRIYGSKDSINWDILDTKTNITYDASRFYTGTITTTEYYNHYALSVNKIVAGSNRLEQTEFHIYGKENLGAYYYKNNSVIKYVAGNQSDINLRNTGSWQIVDDFSIPIATTSVLGGVKKGNNINIDGNGTISVDLQSYNGDSTINGTLNVNSNLIVHGTYTTLNTDVYTTEILDITNGGANSTLTIKQTAVGNTNNILNVINSATLNVFNVSSTGNTGIGTTNANNRLHLHNTTANSDVGIRFSDFTSGASATQGFTLGKNTAQQPYLWNFGNTDMLFATNNAEIMRILANGNVGIGTATGIGEKLVVSGNAQITGTISGNGSLLTSINAANISSGTINSLRLPIAGTGTIGGLKVDGTIHTIITDTLKIIEPTSKQIVDESVIRVYPPIRNFSTWNGSIYDSYSGRPFTVSGQLYGNGIYTVYYTSTGGASAPPSNLWSQNGDGTWGNNYTSSTGLYNKTLSIVDDSSYLGDGVKIQFPVSIKITSYTLKRTSYEASAPKDIRIYGSKDSINWDILDTKTNITYDASQFYTGTITTTEYYNHYALSVNKISQGSIVMQMSQWLIYGKENLGGYYYKNNSVIKYVAGNQSDINLRNTGSWQIVDDISSIPIATTSVLGGVKKGNHINIDGNGTISVDLQSYNGDSTITNEGANSTLTIKQTTAGNTNNILNVINSATLNVFNVSSTGNAGIGTTNANNRLHLHNTTANSDVGIRFSDFTSGASATQGFTIGKNTSQQAYLWNFGNTDMLFATNNAEIMRILANGNVGIGTATGIGEKLVVSGNAQITGTISGNGSLLTSINAANISSGTINSLRLPIAGTGTIGGLKVDGTIHTIITDTLKIIEPTSKQIVDESVIRVYPPIRNFSSWNGSVHDAYSGRPFTVSSQLYGNGIYTVYYTSSADPSIAPSVIWKGDGHDGTWPNLNYTNGTGIYNKTLSIVGDTYLGDGVSIKLPVSIKITSYTLKHSDNGDAAAKDFRIYGSKNSINWDILDTKTNITYDASRFYTGTITTTEYYNHYALSVNRVAGGFFLQMSLWLIYGKENSGYYYKNNSIIKYVAGNQSDINLRNTGSWQIVDDITADNYTKAQIDTNIYTKAQIDTNIYTKTQSDANYYTKVVSDANYYTKTQSDTNYYTKTEINTNNYTKTEINTNNYTKAQIDTNIYTKAQIDTNIYTKTQSDTNYYTKVVSDTNYYTKTQIDGKGYLTTIPASGNVGIGTTDPASRLHLHNTTANADVAIRFTNGNSGFLGTDGFVIGHVDTNGYIWNYETTGAIYFGTNNSESMRIIANGNVGIGTNNPATYKCQVNGDIGASGNVIAYYSDERLKNITEYIDNVLPILDKINVFKYNCNDLAESFGYDKSKKEIGLSAQEIQKYYPEIVSIAPFDADYDEETKQIISKSGENYLTLDYQRLVPVLLQAIKELNHKYTSLEGKYNKIMPK